MKQPYNGFENLPHSRPVTKFYCSCVCMADGLHFTHKYSRLYGSVMVLERERMHDLVEAIEKSLYPAAVVTAMASSKPSRCLLTTRRVNAPMNF